MAYDRANRWQGKWDLEVCALILLHPSLQRALLAYGAGATLAGALTFVLRLGDTGSLLGSGAGALIVAGALPLVRRTFAMEARLLKELEVRRIVLGIGTLAAVFGTLIFVLAIARWQFEVVANRVLWITAAWGVVNLAAAWAAVRRLATYLEPRKKPPSQRTRDDDKPGGRS